MKFLIFITFLLALSMPAFAKRVCQKDAECPSGAECCISNGKFPKYIETFCFGVIKSGQTCVAPSHACCRERDSVQQQIEIDIRSIAEEIPKRPKRNIFEDPLTTTSTIVITPTTIDYTEYAP